MVGFGNTTESGENKNSSKSLPMVSCINGDPNVFIGTVMFCSFCVTEQVVPFTGFGARRTIELAGAADPTHRFGRERQFGEEADAVVHDAISHTDIERRVIDIVKEVLALDDEPATIDVSITDDLKADSLDQLSLTMALEDEFGSKISDEEAARMATLADIVSYVQDRAERTR